MKILFAVTVAVLMSCASHAAKVQVLSKSLKEASHFELSGMTDWHYETSRAEKNGTMVVSIQFSGVKPEEIQSLENFRDKRVLKTVVKEGLNKDAAVDFYLAGHMNFFDYQTDSPTVLVFDVYQEAQKVKKVSKTTAKPKLSDFARITKKKKGTRERSVASVENMTIGYQPPLLTDDKNPPQFNVLDLADKDNSRFNLNDSEINPDAIIKSEKEIYLSFPELIKQVQPTLADIENNKKIKFEITPTKDEENQIVRLIVRLFKEEKYAMALRTFKFLDEKYPKSNYAEILHLLKAEIYYNIWKRDQKLPDLQTAVALYNEHILRYPETPYKDSLVYFLGMIKFESGQYVDSLNHFQAAVKDYPNSPYYWSMRMAIAESYRSLRQKESAIAELESIEKDPKAGDLAQQATFRRGDVYFKMGQYKEAIAEYAKVIKAYPENTKDSPSAYYNTAESLFRQKEYKKSLEQYLLFIKKFPEHDYCGFAMNRVASDLEILGAGYNKVLGAYLEDYYRYRGSPGAYLSKLKINLMRFEKMKPKEVEAVEKESQTEMPVGKIDDVQSLVKISLADGYLKRHEFEKALEIYARFYKENIRSEYLPLMKERIFKTLTAEINDQLKAKKDMDVIQTYLRFKDNWLKDNDRADTEYFVGKSYERLNLLDQAEKYYDNTFSKISNLSKDQEHRRLIFENDFSLDSLRLRIAKVSLAQDEVKKSSKYLEEIKDAQSLSPEEKIELSLVTADNAEKEARYDIAIAQLKNLSESWHDKSDLLIEPWLRISKLYDVQKKSGEALQWADKVVGLISSTKTEMDAGLVRQALEYSADLNLKSGETEKAISIYKSLIEKFADGKIPISSIKFKLGKIYFDQNNIKEAERVWGELRTTDKDDLWTKMADENLVQLKWSDRFKRYVKRQPSTQEEKK